MTNLHSSGKVRCLLSVPLFWSVCFELHWNVNLVETDSVSSEQPWQWIQSLIVRCNQICLLDCQSHCIFRFPNSFSHLRSVVFMWLSWWVCFILGIVGDWKNHFNSEQLARFTSVIREELKNETFCLPWSLDWTAAEEIKSRHIKHVGMWECGTKFWLFTFGVNFS